MMNTESKISSDLTTLDFIKAAALVIMIIDHFGFYFMVPPPGALAGDPSMWWRAVGRFGLPVWFFLIGYARGRNIPRLMIIGAVILTVANLVTGMFVFPLNALVSMILIRLVIDRLARVTFGSLEGCIGVLFLMVVLFKPTNLLTEYGTIGVWMALMGWVVRNGATSDLWLFRTRARVNGFLALGIVATIISQMISFSFNMTQNLVMSAGIVGAFVILITMKPTSYPKLSACMPYGLRGVIQICGRRTMELYVAHLVLFKFVALIFGLGFPIYGWFEWDWTIYGAFTHPKIP